MKKLITLILCLGLVFGVAGCTSGSDDAAIDPTAAPNTLGTKLLASFKAELENTDDIMAIAETLSAEDFCGYNCGIMECEEGYLNGFDSEISGFSSAVTFSPMIGSIPFVCYIFRTDDTEALLAMLNEHADPRWNICTEAEETVAEAVDNYVFFTMCPGEDAE